MEEDDLARVTTSTQLAAKISNSAYRSSVSLHQKSAISVASLSHGHHSHYHYHGSRSKPRPKTHFKFQTLYPAFNFRPSHRKAIGESNCRIQPIKVERNALRHIVCGPNELHKKIDNSGPPGGFTEEDVKMVNQLPSDCTLSDLLNRLINEPPTSLILAFIFSRVLNDEVMSSRDSSGLTPAMICASRNWQNTLQWILDLNSNAELTNDENTALHIAVYYGHYNVVSCILENNGRKLDLERKVCFTDAHMKVYRTALQLAVQQFRPTEEHKRIIQLLVDGGCSVFTEMEGGFDCLSVAALSPYIADILPTLLTSKQLNSSTAFVNLKTRKYPVGKNIYLNVAEMVQYNYYLRGDGRMEDLLQQIDSLIHNDSNGANHEQLT